MFFKNLIMSFVLLTSFNLYGGDKVVYGPDDRLDLHETAVPLYLELAVSTAAQVANHKITDNSDGTSSLSGGTLRSWGVCAGEKFDTQPTSARCSGFLVGPNLLVTAGHCLTSTRDCSNYKWVFDYAYDTQSRDASVVPTSSVYSCARIVERSLDGSTRNDYALIELDRDVTDRAPLSYRKSGKVAKNANLVVIGHPTGLPTKIADNAVVRENRNAVYFESNLDTFGGNSGSAVFNVDTGEIEGILVRGETDYVRDRSRGCNIPNKCTDTGCSGEEVTRITNIQALK